MIRGIVYMYGYKAMPVKNGVISCGYELGKMKVVNNAPLKYHPDHYLHFCKKLEEPLLFWGRDYIDDALKDASYPTYHLFRVKAEGTCRQNTEHGWVTDKLTILNEVSKKEIVEYFDSRPELVIKLHNSWEKRGIDDDTWERYKANLQQYAYK